MKELENAFLELTEQYKRLIYKVCYLYASERNDANDLFQDVILNLWKGFPLFRGESRIETWIYRIALNTCISQLRKQSKRPLFVPLSVEVTQLYEPDEENRMAELYRLIQKLNAMEKALILLYLEDRSYDEIAQLTGISKTNVGTKLTRIKEKLKQLSDQ